MHTLEPRNPGPNILTVNLLDSALVPDCIVVGDTALLNIT